jgi:hypothetical protein
MWNAQGHDGVAGVSPSPQHAGRMASLMKGALMRRVLIPTNFSDVALLVTREAQSTCAGGCLGQP